MFQYNLLGLLKSYYLLTVFVQFFSTVSIVRMYQIVHCNYDSSARIFRLSKFIYTYIFCSACSWSFYLLTVFDSLVRLLRMSDCINLLIETCFVCQNVPIVQIYMQYILFGLLIKFNLLTVFVPFVRLFRLYECINLSAIIVFNLLDCSDWPN